MIYADGDNGFRAALNDSDTNTAPEFFVRKFTANPYASASRLAAAELILEDTSRHNVVIKATTAVINCHGTGNPGIFGSDRAFPGRTINVQDLGIGAESTGIITIHQAADWTFGVYCTDSFGLTIGDFSLSLAATCASAITLGAFNIIDSSG